MTKSYILAFVLMFSICSRFKTPVEPGEIVGKQYAVYSQIIRSMFLHDHTERLVIKEKTVHWDMSNNLDYLKENMPELQDSTLEDFLQVNKEVQQLDKKFTIPVETTMLSKEEFDDIFENGGWDEFYKRYPGAPGIIAFSQVGFNHRKDQALTYVENSVHYLAGAGYLILMVKGDVWKIQKSIMVWIS